MLCIGKKHRQGRTGAGGDGVERLWGGVFDPFILDGNGKLHALGGRFQEGAFLGRGFEQGHGNAVSQHFPQDKARKAGSGAQIRQGPCFQRNEGRQLGRIPEMPPPKVFQGTSRNQIMAGIPVLQQIGISFQPGQCFT